MNGVHRPCTLGFFVKCLCFIGLLPGLPFSLANHRTCVSTAFALRFFNPTAFSCPFAYVARTCGSPPLLISVVASHARVAPSDVDDGGFTVTRRVERVASSTEISPSSRAYAATEPPATLRTLGLCQCTFSTAANGLECDREGAVVGGFEASGEYAGRDGRGDGLVPLSRAICCVPCLSSSDLDGKTKVRDVFPAVTDAADGEATIESLRALSVD